MLPDFSGLDTTPRMITWFPFASVYLNIPGTLFPVNRASAGFNDSKLKLVPTTSDAGDMVIALDSSA